MSKETAKKLIADLQSSEELKAKVNGITDPVELLKIAVEAGYDVTAEEMIEAEKEKRAEQSKNTDEKLALDDLEGAAGGELWGGEDAPDGHEMGCLMSYYGMDYQRDNNIWCRHEYYCTNANYEGTGYITLPD